MYTSIQSIWGVVVISPHMLLHRLANIRKKEAIIIYIDPMPSIIRKYGSTFYIGIAMVVLPYIGPWEN